jgi:hypothetical protein
MDIVTRLIAVLMTGVAIVFLLLYWLFCDDRDNGAQPMRMQDEFEAYMARSLGHAPPRVEWSGDRKGARALPCKQIQEAEGQSCQNIFYFHRLAQDNFLGDRVLREAKASSEPSSTLLPLLSQKKLKKSKSHRDVCESPRKNHPSRPPGGPEW